MNTYPFAVGITTEDNIDIASIEQRSNSDDAM